MTEYHFTLPIKITNEANKSRKEHWSKPHARKLIQQQEVKFALVKYKFELPCKVIIIRVSPRVYDYDNFIFNCKILRDSIASIIIPGLKPGRADANPDLTFEYTQIKGLPKENHVLLNIIDSKKY